MYSGTVPSTRWGWFSSRERLFLKNCIFANQFQPDEKERRRLWKTNTVSGGAATLHHAGRPSKDYQCSCMDPCRSVSHKNDYSSCIRRARISIMRWYSAERKNVKILPGCCFMRWVRATMQKVQHSLRNFPIYAQESVYWALSDVSTSQFWLWVREKLGKVVDLCSTSWWIHSDACREHSLWVGHHLFVYHDYPAPSMVGVSRLKIGKGV